MTTLVYIAIIHHICPYVDTLLSIAPSKTYKTLILLEFRLCFCDNNGKISTYNEIKGDHTNARCNTKEKEDV